MIRTQEPDLNQLAFHKILLPKQNTLNNSIPFYQLISGAQDVLRLEIIFKAGSLYEAKESVAHFTAKMLSEGTKDFSAKEIQEKIAFYGAFMELNSGFDRSALTVYCLARHLDKLLPIISQIIIEPTFPEQELETLKLISTQSLRVNQEKTAFLASARFRKLLFGQHPYGSCMSEAGINAISRDDLIQFHNKYYSLGNATILITGGGNTNYFNLINEHFGKHQLNIKNQIFDSIASWGNPNTEIIVKESSIQSSIRLGCQLFTIKHEDYFKTSVLIEILGGYFGSRLMKNIREDKGYTYGIHANFAVMKNNGYLVIGTDVNKENTKATLEEIYKEINLLKLDKVNLEELNLVKNYLKGSFINSINTTYSQVDKFKTLLFNNLPVNFYETYFNTLTNITAEEIQATALKYFQIENFYEVVVGNK
ncbi:peptidase M16 [Sporocytophaga myxococcoides]|uniref:Peptidase M16 n=1 Tax=Sporocytophaga myxococcoides TaxID=153721 RepID=A0A098LM97_9BACT|nr:peptidase M16 [Sporocytophaga myxococcoides]